ncbi:MAG TPA: PDDEXK nuclease domain-containing protein [Pyrinomonadaceae bacterium]|nr:PDDEXK nuclease domain-containing protein [Pyrinomonadaceae bacterium]
MNLSKGNYAEFLAEVKSQIKSNQAKAALAVNAALIAMYWNIGEMIAENQALFAGRNNYIDQLAKDIQAEFPGIKGFSRTNLFSIRQFYIFYSQNSVQQLVGLSETAEDLVQQTVALNEKTSEIFKLLVQLPWGHHILILTKVKEPEAACFYLQQTIENNWSRAVLTLHIEQNLFSRQGKALSNFTKTLPEQQARIAQQMLKDPYNFEFLTLEPKVQELEIEKSLTEHITKFLLELGKGFAFIGRQYNLKIGEKDYFIDLLFYHIRLRCFVVIELKGIEFEPEFAGKLNFYLSAVDDLLKNEYDQPSIGILLCKSKDKIEVEYALRDINKPIGVSEFTFTEILPDELIKEIPTVEEFEKELQ